MNIDLLCSILSICDKTDAIVYDEIWGSDLFSFCFNIKVDKYYNEKKH